LNNSAATGHLPTGEASIFHPQLPTIMPVLFADSLLPLLAIAGLGMVIAMILMRGGLRRRRSSDEHWHQVERPSGQRARSAPKPDDLASWEVDMHETARALSARLDSKMSALQALIADADRAAERLERAGRGE
jgi:hypothetical protein